MPIVKREAGSIQGDLGNITEPTITEPQEHTASEVFGAAFRMENTAVSLINSQTTGINTPFQNIDRSFDPFEDIEGFEQFADEFTFANSQQDVEAVKRQITREQQDRQILQESGALGFVASLSAGRVDPINFIPVGGVAYKTYRSGGSILQGAVATGIAGTLGATAAETALHHSQTTRTFGESAVNISGAALLSGLLGGAASKISRANFDELSTRIENELVVPRPDEKDPLEGGFLDNIGNSVIVSEPGTAGAAQVRITTLEEETIAGALGVEKAVAFQDPLLRTMVRGSLPTKLAVSKLVENPLKTNKNLTGITQDVPVETIVNGDQAELISSLANQREAFIKYRKGRAPRFGDDTSLAAQDIAGGFVKQDKLTFTEFKEEIGKAMRRGGNHDIPEVAQAAKFYRENLFKPWADRLKKAGMIPDGIADEKIETYLTRLYSNDKIDGVNADGSSSRNTFKDRIREGLQQKTNEAPVKLQDLTTKIDKVKTLTKESTDKVSAKIKPKTAKVKKLEKELNQITFKTDDVSVARKKELNEQLKPLRKEIKALNKEIVELRKSRDFEVKNIKEDVKKVKRDFGRFEEEIDFRAGQIIDRIMGTTAGRLPYDIDFSDLTVPGGRAVPPTTGTPKPTKARGLDFNDEFLEEFLVNDVEQIAKVYLRSISPDFRIKEKFGDVEMLREMETIRADADKKMSNAKGKEVDRIKKQREADLRDLQAMRDRIRGVYGVPTDPTNGIVRTGRVFRNVNFLAQMGGVLVSSIPDMANIIIKNGMGRFLTDGLIPLATNFKSVKLAAKEAQLSGEAGDLLKEGTIQEIAGIMDGTIPGSKFERGVGNLSATAGKVFGISQWNTWLKQFVSVIAQKRLVDLSAKLVNGTANKREISDLAANFIDKRIARKILNQRQHMQKQGNLIIVNTDKWQDAEAVNAFRGAIGREIRRTIVTPGQDKPLLLSTELGKLVGQYQSFGFASMQRVALSGLQDRDMQTLVGLTSMVGLGVMVHMLKALQSGREIDTSPEALIAEGIDRSGVTGWLFSANNMLEKGTGGAVGVSRVLGKQPSGRYAARNATDALLGPSLGTLETVVGTTGAIARGEFNQQDARALRRLVPFQNTFYLRNIFDEAEQNINQTLGVPPR